MKPSTEEMEKVTGNADEVCLISLEDIEATYGALPSKEDVDNLAKKYLKDTYRHCLDVAKVMKYFAKKL
jgi:tetrahydromethanopterin S-methyltransferase subunit B